MRLKVAFAVIALAALASCGTTGSTSQSVVPTTDDLRWIKTLRALDEKGDGVVGAAKFQSSSKDLSTLADEAGHAHRKRTEEIKSWRASAFRDAVELPACGQQVFRVGSKPSDMEIVDAFIAHRECVLNYTNGALANVRSANTRHVLEDASRIFEAELKQLRTWRETWR